NDFLRNTKLRSVISERRFSWPSTKACICVGGRCIGSVHSNFFKQVRTPADTGAHLVQPPIPCSLRLQRTGWVRSSFQPSLAHHPRSSVRGISNKGCRARWQHSLRSRSRRTEKSVAKPPSPQYIAAEPPLT